MIQKMEFELKANLSPQSHNSDSLIDTLLMKNNQNIENEQNVINSLKQHFKGKQMEI